MKETMNLKIFIIYLKNFIIEKKIFDLNLYQLIIESYVLLLIYFFYNIYHIETMRNSGGPGQMGNMGQGMGGHGQGQSQFGGMG